MKQEQWLADLIEKKRDLFIGVSDRIWEYAETRYEEYQSSRLLGSVLEQEGFIVEYGVGGIETAFIGSYGHGKPVIALLGEYDALSGLSQRSGVAQKEPVVQGGNGHGCGHNLLGAGALAAAVAVRHYMEETGLPGTVRYYGCPAEEGGSGKGFMVRARLFDDADIALTWHPDDTTAVFSSYLMATHQVYYRFRGKSSHAAKSPHLGRSALDAVELMNVGANYLREHVVPEARLHYAITNTGGHSPNVVQDEAEVLYMLRAPHQQVLRELYARVSDIARGAALMTGTELESRFDSACSNLILNTTMERILDDSLNRLGLPSYDEQERLFARELRAGMTEEERSSSRYPETRGCELQVAIPPYEPKAGLYYVSSDVGDVSWVVPTAQLCAATWAAGTSAHSWQAVAQGQSSIAHKGLLHAGKVLAAAAVTAMQQPKLIESARAEWLEALNGERYHCPIPPDIQPPAAPRKQ